MSYQQRLFDGYVVETNRGSIGAFDIEEGDADHYRADEVLVMVVTATVSGANFGQTKAGEWVRTNKLTASQVHVASGPERDAIVAMFNLAGDELPFPPHPTSPQDNTRVVAAAVGTHVVSDDDDPGDNFPDDLTYGDSVGDSQDEQVYSS